MITHFFIRERGKVPKNKITASWGNAIANIGQQLTGRYENSLSLKKK